MDIVIRRYMSDNADLCAVSQNTAKPRLMERVRGAIRARHYSRRTEASYVHWIKRYIYFHAKRHPEEMGAAEVTAFLTSLAVERRQMGSMSVFCIAEILLRPPYFTEPDLACGQGLTFRRSAAGRSPVRCKVLLSCLDKGMSGLFGGKAPGNHGSLTQVLREKQTNFREVVQVVAR